MLREEQIDLRRQRARAANLTIENLGKNRVFSDYRVINPQTKGQYTVTVRGFDTGDNACTCPDFKSNTLGTCKHIEAVLDKHAAVAQSVVLAREDTPGDKRLVAYVAAPQAAADLGEQLRAHIRASLPEHMMPSAFVVLEKLPLTPNGKVDRKALPAPDGAVYARRGYEAPRGEVEEKLAGIWDDEQRAAGFDAVQRPMLGQHG